MKSGASSRNPVLNFLKVTTVPKYMFVQSEKITRPGETFDITPVAAESAKGVSHTLSLFC